MIVLNLKWCFFQKEVSADRIKAGLSKLPSLEEREAVKQEYLKKKRVIWDQTLKDREALLRQHGWKTKTEKAAEAEELKRKKEDESDLK